MKITQPGSERTIKGRKKFIARIVEKFRAGKERARKQKRGKTKRKL